MKNRFDFFFVVMALSISGRYQVSHAENAAITRIFLRRGLPPDFREKSIACSCSDLRGLSALVWLHSYLQLCRLSPSLSAVSNLPECAAVSLAHGARTAGLAGGRAKWMRGRSRFWIGVDVFSIGDGRGHPGERGK